ncbi:MAG: NAD(P)-dependent oxidoreductase [Verrucomicrobiae bacterium]
MPVSKLLVTGATGFVGRNLLLRAASSGIPVWAPVRSAEKLRACLADDGLPPGAAIPLPPEPDAWGDPSHAVLSAGVLFARSREEYFSVNVDWALRALRALPAECRVVILSSQSAGGPTPSGCLAREEAHQDRPITWYGESKLAMENAIAREFPHRPITVLRPPMILGARDSATLPLFKMARGIVRTKPGLRKKLFSFLAVEDVVDAIFAAFDCGRRGPFYIASALPVSDIELIGSAARAVGGHGITVRVPQCLVRVLAAAVDAVPAWRAAAPSLTRDRAKEIWPGRWVVDPSAFRAATGWSPRISLDEALQSACSFYRASRRL